MKCIKKTVRHYWKYRYDAWTQPVLSANGIIGGDSFAVAHTNASVSGSYPTWKAFDGNDATFTQWSGVDSYIVWYNPKRLNASNVYIKWYHASYMSDSTLQGSNDNANWDDLGTFLKTEGTEKNISLSNAKYKYFRLHTTPTGLNDLCTITTTATEETIIAGTESDYDFYIDDEVVLLPKETKATYWKELKEYTETSTETLNLSAGKYRFIAVGGGAGAAVSTENDDVTYAFGVSSGGSGAYMKADFQLEAGNYTINVGKGGAGAGGWNGDRISEAGGDTYISLNGNDIFRVSGASYARSKVNGYGINVTFVQSIGGTVTTSDKLIKVIEQEQGENGKTRAGYSTQTGGASKYEGYGAGGLGYCLWSDVTANSGTAGYLKIYVESDETDYDIVETETKYYGINQ